MAYLHKQLAQGRWYELSVIEQLGNIGSEVERAIKWKQKGDSKTSQQAFYRALDLFDLTMDDPRYRQLPGNLKEICRAREIVCDYLVGDNQYQSSDESLRNYFFPFAFAARKDR